MKNLNKAAILFVLFGLLISVVLLPGGQINVAQAADENHEIAYWWGKVNQHEENGVWSTDPDGTSGANLNKYTYCKKWYPSTQYAIYDNDELISGWKNAGNTGNFSLEVPTYKCTELNALSDYEAQNKLFKNGEPVNVSLSDSETVKIEVVASSGYADFAACGDTRIRFKVNDNYLSRYLCVGDLATTLGGYHTDTTSYNNGNGKINITLNKIIQGSDNVYAVADVVKENTEIAPSLYPDLYLEDLKWNNQNPVVGDYISFSAKIKNIGSAATGLYNISWNLMKSGYPMEAAISSASGYASILPGQYATNNNNNWLEIGGYIITNNPNNSTAPNAQGSGTYTLTLILDQNNGIAELNESNNVDTASIYVAPDQESIPETPQADLVISSIETVTNASTGQVTSLNITLKNNNGSLPAAIANTYLNDNWLNGFSTSANPSSSEVTWQVNVDPSLLITGSNLVKVIADPYNTIAESNENNNTTTKTFNYNTDGLKHEIAYWYGKVNQHKESGVWTTDPDGTSGASLNKYTYCKKWYPTTQYAVYDNDEYITGWKNAGNTGNFSLKVPTYECTELNVISDYEAQKKLFKNNEETTITSNGETIKVKIEASSGYADFAACGDTRIRFKVNDNYLSRYLCVGNLATTLGGYHTDTVTYDNGNVNISLTKIIQGGNNIYAVADVSVEKYATTLPVDVGICTDSDGGKNYYKKGKVEGTWQATPGGEIIIQEDFCADNTVQEFYCDTNSNTGQYGIVQTGYTCAYGCQNGTCLESPTTDLKQDVAHHIYQKKKTTAAKNILNNIQGKIVLQVENKGEAYYISPNSEKIYYLKDGSSAFQIMKETGLGISETDFMDLMSGTLNGEQLRKRLAGKIVLRVNAHGEAYYINPETLSVTYMPNGVAAFKIMKEQGLGINNQNLETIIE